MKESRQHFMITAERDAFLNDLQQALDKFAVPSGGAGGDQGLSRERSG